MPRVDRYNDSEDMFADTRMSFGDHIEELRTHLLRALAGFMVGMLVGLAIGPWAVGWIKAPVEEQLHEFWNRRDKDVFDAIENHDPRLTELNAPVSIPVEFDWQQLREALGMKGGANPPEGASAEPVVVDMRVNPLNLMATLHKAQRFVSDSDRLAVMGPVEGFMVYMKVSVVCGAVLASPWIFWQLWAFVAAGLYPSEKRLVNVYLPFSLGLFLAGFFLCEEVVIPRAIRWLLQFNDWLGLKPDLRLNEWLSFAILTPLIFGLAFQTPLVMLFLAKLRIFTVETYRSKRRIAWFLIVVIAALIAPSPDVVSYFGLWVPMLGLYELGILLAQYATRDQDTETDVPEPEEMVEV
jgi:sec-independent protein translocase protein TatC